MNGHPVRVEDVGRLPLLLNAREAAASLRVGRNAVYEGIERGEVPSIKVGRSIRIPTALLLERLGVPVPPMEGPAPSQLGTGPGTQ